MLLKVLQQVLRKIPAPLLFIISGITQYLGAAVAVGVFTLLPPTATAWWRFAVASLVLVAWQKPWRAGLTRLQVRNALIFGIFMGGMNIAFYESVARIDLGVAVSIEFLGPVTVAVAMNRSWRGRLAAFLSLAGVVGISGFALDLSAPQIGWGLFFCFLAGALWTGYIIFGKRVSVSPGLNALAIGACAATVVFSPFGVSSIPLVFSDWLLLGKVALVALMSTVVPYSLDQIVMRRLEAATFSLLNALLPATSLLIGVVFLAQVPSVSAILGLVLISVAVWLATSQNRC